MNPKYPIYVISKGRWEGRLTVKALIEMDVSHSVVVEPQEHESYAAVMNETNILTLPFSNLGQGSIPARNWVWEHSISRGQARHWILDDNIAGFRRFNRNQKYKVVSGAFFRAMEEFVDRYVNVAIAGQNYRFFVEQKNPDKPPITMNTRVYSCILIDNELPFRWRGRYNEDTDLSLRALKAGYCTVLFNAFLVDKIATMTMKGGNTDELYAGDGRLEMARSLKRQHPDVVEVKRRWGRWQHVVDYRPFRNNKLYRKPGVARPPKRKNDYGMKLKRVSS